MDGNIDQNKNHLATMLKSSVSGHCDSNCYSNDCSSMNTIEMVFKCSGCKKDDKRMNEKPKCYKGIDSYNNNIIIDDSFISSIQ